MNLLSALCVKSTLYLALQKKPKQTQLTSYYPKMLIKDKITSSDLLLFWNIKHVHTGTPLQKTRKQH